MLKNSKNMLKKFGVKKLKKCVKKCMLNTQKMC